MSKKGIWIREKKKIECPTRHATPQIICRVNQPCDMIYRGVRTAGYGHIHNACVSSLLWT